LNGYDVNRNNKQSLVTLNQIVKEIIMWTKPEVTEMRFGFEVTMYVCNR